MKIHLDIRYFRNTSFIVLNNKAMPTPYDLKGFPINKTILFNNQYKHLCFYLITYKIIFIRILLIFKFYLLVIEPSQAAAAVLLDTVRLGGGRTNRSHRFYWNGYRDSEDQPVPRKSVGTIGTPTTQTGDECTSNIRSI